MNESHFSKYEPNVAYNLCCVSPNSWIMGESEEILQFIAKAQKTHTWNCMCTVKLGTTQKSMQSLPNKCGIFWSPKKMEQTYSSGVFQRWKKNCYGLQEAVVRSKVGCFLGRESAGVNRPGNMWLSHV